MPQDELAVAGGFVERAAHLLNYSCRRALRGVSVDQQIQDDADQLTFLWLKSGQQKGTKR